MKKNIPTKFRANPRITTNIGNRRFIVRQYIFGKNFQPISKNIEHYLLSDQYPTNFANLCFSFVLALSVTMIKKSKAVSFECKF